MRNLKHVQIFRCGVTATSYNFETSQCRYDVNEDDLRLQFNIASKGGGDTSILVKMKSDGLPAVLKEIALTNPRTAELFADALRDAEIALAKKQSAELSKLTKRVASLDDYVRERWFEKPVGKDRLEEKLWDTTQEVKIWLRELSERVEARLSADPVLSAKKSKTKRATTRSK